MPRVIGIQESDIAAATFLDSPVPSGGYTCIQLANVSDPFAVAADHRCGVISGTVVYYQHFEIEEGLAEYAANRIRQIPGRVVRRDNDGYFRHAIPREPLSATGGGAQDLACGRRSTGGRIRIDAFIRTD